MTKSMSLEAAYIKSMEQEIAAVKKERDELRRGLEDTAEARDAIKAQLDNAESLIAALRADRNAEIDALQENIQNVEGGNSHGFRRLTANPSRGFHKLQQEKKDEC